MKKRILSSLVLLPLLVVVYLGGYWLLWGVLTITVLGLNEFYIGCEQICAKPSRFIGYLSVALLYVFNIFPATISNSSFSVTIGLWIFIVIFMCLLYGFKVEERRVMDVMATFMGIIYVGFLAQFIYKLDILAGTKGLFGPWIWLVFTIAFGTDIFAYFVGSACGKHKLCPNLSRKKTIEGAIGGVLGSIILSVAFVAIFKDSFEYMYQFTSYSKFIVIIVVVALIGSVFAQLGDLSASSLKRMMGLKDFGNLIPGHGGILDRFDSVLFVAPFIYAFVSMIPIIFGALVQGAQFYSTLTIG